MKRNKLTVALISILCIATLFLSACSPKPSPSPSANAPGTNAPGTQTPQEPVTISFWGGWTGPDADTMKGIVDKYMAENKNVTIDLEMQQWTPLFTKFLAEASGGNAPNILAMRPMDMGQFIELGILQDDFAQTIGIDAANYSTSSWQGTMYNNKQYAIPLDQHMHGIFYNKDLFAKAGITNPPTTGDELIATAQKLTLDSNGKNATESGFDPNKIVQYGIAFNMNHHVGFQMSALINQQGQNPFTSDMKQVSFDTDKAVAGLTFLQDLVHKYHVTPIGDKSPVDSFVAGNVAMFIDGPWQMPTLEATDINWGTAAYPTVFGTQSAWGNAHIFTFPKTKATDAQNAAVKDFIQWMDKNSGEWGRSGQIPASKSGKEFAATLPGREAFINSMETMYTLPASPKSAELFGSSATSPFVVAAQSLLLDKANPTDVVNNLRNNMNAILSTP